ncbi:hypothetical protein GGU11DRAFT_759667 [Lentinula aff. detonsa]|nr:hypothetical protein GGU11DRAFT_759667 [Lentinula aff. detonsa]
MSTTLSPARQAHSNSPTIVEGDAGLQAFLAAAQQEAQENWEVMHAQNAPKMVEKVVVDQGEVIEKDAEAVMEFEQEVVHKVKPPSRKLMTHMVVVVPCPSCEVILTSMVVDCVSPAAQCSQCRSL